MEFFKSAKGSALIVLLSLGAVAVIFLSILFRSEEPYEESVFYSMDAMIEIVGPNNIKNDVKEIFADAENIFDCHKENSEVSKLNSAGSAEASEKLKNSLEEIISLNKKYGNSADITVGELTRLWDITGDQPGIPDQDKIDKALKTVGYENIKINGSAVTLENGARLDLGCAAKGAALDYVKERFDEKNSGKAVISAGSSSILLYGDSSFTTKIQSPENENGILGELHTGPGFISTSGGYHRFTEIDGKKYIHIIDTKTGSPSETGLTSVTVFCQSGIDSDFLSTLIFADGTENINKYLGSEEFKIVAADKDRNVYVSHDLDFRLTDESYKLCETK